MRREGVGPGGDGDAPSVDARTKDDESPVAIACGNFASYIFLKSSLRGEAQSNQW